MLQFIWIIGAVWVAVVTFYLNRHQRHAALEATETAVALISLFTLVELAAYFTT